MVIVITGAVGIGKTTVCREIVKKVREQGYTCGGILTYKEADNSLIIEEIQTGKKETLASINSVYDGPRTARYYFNPSGIEFGIKAIKKGSSMALLVVDEIGRLELNEKGLAPVLDIIEAGEIKNCILVIRSELLPAFLDRISVTPLVFEVTVSNRRRLARNIGVILRKGLN